MRKNKRKWICILVLSLLFCISAAAVMETRVQAAQTQETTGFVKKKGKTYYYKNGKKQKGLKTIDGSKYYFSKVTGVMQTKVFKTVKGKKYYFGANGKAVKGLKTIKKNLYYFNTSCVMQKGWKTVNGVKYYFASNGKAYRNTTKKVGKIYARFDENGAYQITASYCMVNGRKMQVQYRTDPQVSDEILLAAILYAEAGGERQTALSATLDQETIRVYKGQLAVGYTILNRMASRSYPSTVKEVVYAQYQFEPARTGVLTALLKDQTRISTECKNTAKLLLKDYKAAQDSVKAFPRSEFTWYNFWALSYARNYSDFFSVYKKSEYQIIGNQVFFNYTKTIHSQS